MLSSPILSIYDKTNILYIPFGITVVMAAATLICFLTRSLSFIANKIVWCTLCALGAPFLPFLFLGGALWADYLTPGRFRSLFQISTAVILIPTSNLHDPPKIALHNRRPSALNEKSDSEKKNRNSFDN